MCKRQEQEESMFCRCIREVISSFVDINSFSYLLKAGEETFACN